MSTSASKNKEKVVLVTGSSSGIGAATVKLFAEEGYKVVVTGRSKEKIDQVAEECDSLSPHGHKALRLESDLFELSNSEAIVRQTIEHFKRLDVLVNNVGITRNHCADDKTSLPAYREAMAINVESVMRTTMEAIEHLVETKGNIVFVSSVASMKPAAKGYAYRMSKAALTSYAKCLAIDIAPKIRVNIVSPGPVATPIFQGIGMDEEQTRRIIGPRTLLNRVGETPEVASAIVFLASDKASYINGADLVVDGGYIIKPPK